MLIAMPNTRSAPVRISCLVLLSLLLLPFGLSAGMKVKFDHLTMADGLPEDAVLTMLQDRQGLLWLGTQNGLVKYDGYTFTTYKPDPEDPYSIGGRIIMTIYEDRAGDLWIGTRRGGLNKFDRATERFILSRPN